MLPRITPVAPVRTTSPFDNTDFIAEWKADGFRALAYIESGTARLISRKGIRYKSKPFLCTVLAALRQAAPFTDGNLTGCSGYLKFCTYRS